MLTFELILMHDVWGYFFSDSPHSNSSVASESTATSVRFCTGTVHVPSVLIKGALIELESTKPGNHRR